MKIEPVAPRPAHTIYHVPPHIERVPAYVRKALAASGPKVKIGCMYQPSIAVLPAVHIPKPRRVRLGRICRYALAVAAVALLYWIGSDPGAAL